MKSPYAPNHGVVICYLSELTIKVKIVVVLPMIKRSSNGCLRAPSKKLF
jgi:hypothetical protein